MAQAGQDAVHMVQVKEGLEEDIKEDVKEEDEKGGDESATAAINKQAGGKQSLSTEV